MTKPDPATSGGERQQTEIGSVFVSNYPPYSFWTANQLAQAQAALDRPGSAVPLGLYFHIPFCRRRCKFCYFKVYTDKNAAEVQRYLEALAAETEMLAARPALRGRKPKFVYFGGGTPSFLSAVQLRALVRRLKAAIPWDAVEEVTFECEPGTLTRPKVRALREIGVTRLSLGVENWNDAILEENGRAHVSKEIRRVLPWIAEERFAVVNLDLIAGMVGETWDSWRETVRLTLAAKPEIVTIYQLELPHNTLYSRDLQLDGKSIPVADWSTKRAWHGYAIEQFEAAGYEVSSAYTLVRRDVSTSFLYRDALWHGADLVGCGVSSFSHLSGVHYQNLSAIERYMESIEDGKLPLDRAFAPTEFERMTREWILQLKFGRVEPDEFMKKFGVDVRAVFRPALERLVAEGWVEPGGGAIRLTRQGLLRVDSLLPEFYDARYRGSRYT